MALGDPEDALSESGDETLISFDVTPDASETAVPSGFNQWRTRFEARLAEPARDGRANAELVDAVSERLDAPARLTQGASASKKTVAVAAPLESVLESFTDALDA